MTGWSAKRFWKAAEAAETPGGWEVRLDGRPVRTPAKAPLVLPTRALAEAIAAEWRAQGEIVDPRQMPLTRSANSAIDKVMAQHDEVVALLAAYGETDLLCYRATAPEALCQRQAEAWDPLLAWAAQKFAAPLSATAGIVPVAQPAESLARLRAEVAALDVFSLTAFHDLVALSGSLVLALAVVHGAEAPETLWSVSRVDEDWQAEIWGADAEASETVAAKREDFLRAKRFLDLVRRSG